MSERDLKVTNCVVSCDTFSKYVLEDLAAKLIKAEYNPESFPGLVYRLEEPKASILVFSTGKLICSGSKSLEEATVAIKNAIKDFREHGITVSDKMDVKIVNMVASATLGKKLDLNKIVFELPECEYEPEQFPGVVHRITKPKLVFLLFSSGRIVITGAKSVEMIKEGIDFIDKELTDIKAFKD